MPEWPKWKSRLDAEFLRVEVEFQDTGCATCIASLEGRLSRVRGMERVEIDAERGIAVMHLALKNRVRLTPLLSRITQDGTKILGTKVIARGSVESTPNGLMFVPAQNQSYRLVLVGEAAKAALEADQVYEVRGSVTEADPGGEPRLEAISLEPKGHSL